jgi:lipopolysaccharide/colanic/teichoic acid biosynthesis glycosyltransferase
VAELGGCRGPEERAPLCATKLKILCPFHHEEAVEPTGIGHKIYAVVRRVADIIIALIGLALLLVMLPILAPLIWIQSPGPLFFAQDRIGLGGKIFTIHKIRTMHHKQPDGEALWATDDRERARIFPVGRFLRMTHIDELPQFWNVLTGEMSLVGPRPEQVPIVEELARDIPGYQSRHRVRPGITGLRQVEYGYVGTEIGSWLSTGYDFYYIANQGPLLDLYICFATVPRILSDKDQPEAACNQEE